MGARSGIVAVLVAAELLIIGLIIYSFGGMRGAFASGMHKSLYNAAPIAPINAGDAPHVSVSDFDDRVVVTPSSDGLVHVSDQKVVDGLSWGSNPVLPLKVTRTSDGVRIERPSHSGTDMVFGTVDKRVAIEVPPGSTVAIEDSEGADVTGINGAVNVKSSDGHITLASLHGAVDADSDDGYIDANDLQGNSVKLHSDSGHLKVRATETNALDATTNDGHVDIAGLRISGNAARATIHTDDGSVAVAADFAAGGNYTVSSGDGSVRVTLPPGADLNVSANTGDGSIKRDGQAVHGDSASQTFTLGGGSGRLAVSSGDGTIEFTTNGAI